MVFAKLAQASLGAKSTLESLKCRGASDLWLELPSILLPVAMRGQDMLTISCAESCDLSVT